MVKAYVRVADLRGLGRLASDATVGLTDLVEAMHSAVARVPGLRGDADGKTAGITGLVYKTVRGVTRLVGVSTDSVLGALSPLLVRTESSEEREAVLAALNGVFGDYLAASDNPLAIAMRLRNGGNGVAIARPALAAAFPDPASKVVVLVHGLCMNDLQWTRQAHNHGSALQRDRGYTPVFLHYNTGRHVSTNGREFADLMDTLLREWPRPVERLVIIGHSMGGLVARSACHYAALAGHEWPARLDDLLFLGTPHLGAPLERAGAWVDTLLGISAYTAPLARLGKVRSAGIQDLRHGYLRDEDWRADHPTNGATAHTSLPLPAGVRCHAIAASLQQRAGASGTRIRGDGLVPVNSALGRHHDRARDLGLRASQQWVAYGTGHLDLLRSPVVYAYLRRVIA